MTASPIKQLGAALDARAWVKGAVNHDEDLHFSTYYLRASCAAATGNLYAGYGCLAAFYEGYTETYFVRADEAQTTAQGIVAHALRTPTWLPGMLARIRRHADALEDIFPAAMAPAWLARQPAATLLKLYCRHDVRHRALYRYARLPEALDRGVSYFTNYLRDHLYERCGNIAAAEEALATLTQPIAPSVLAQEIGAFDAIVAAVRRYRANRDAAAASPARLRMTLPSELLRRLEAHCAQWQYLGYHGYGRRDLPGLDHYLERLARQLSHPEELANSNGLQARCAQARREQADCLRRLRIDPPHRALFESYPEIGAVKLYRRCAQLRNFYYLDLLLAETAQRLRVSEWTVRCMLPEEIIASLRAGRLIAPGVEARLDGCAFVILDGQETIVTGAELAWLRQHFDTPAHPPADGNVLHGTVACRGQTEGHVKVVIRAAAFHGEFPKGAILVSESTDPDLVRFLRAAGGVLTEQGGVTSHAAVICRELRIPTIIGIDGLLGRVRDGAWVKMDAERGTVTVRDPRDPPAAVAEPACPRQPPQVIGFKAYNLDVVRGLGFRVPDYVVLGYEDARRIACRPGAAASRQLVRRVLRQLGVSNGAKLAVRSSAVAEDSVAGSAAGAYHSLLNVRSTEVGAALRAFVRGNRLAADGQTYRGSVIVQRMVEADWAGVCLTRDPRLGHGDAVIVEMTPKGNQAVTGGTVRPERVVVERRTGDILEEVRHASAGAPPRVNVASIVREFLTLEARFGQAVDIEWALAGQELFILQARPIVDQTTFRNPQAAAKP